MTTPTHDEAVRQQFEAWMTDDGRHMRAVERNASGDYVLMSTANDWDSWQASYQAALRSPAVAALVEALRKATQFVEAHSEEGGYGFARPSNPHDFSPDQECCTPEEISNHKAACEAFDRGDYQHDEWDGWNEDHTIHVLKAPWGIGSYTMRDKWAIETLDRARAALAQYATLAGENHD